MSHAFVYEPRILDAPIPLQPLPFARVSQVPAHASSLPPGRLLVIDDESPTRDLIRASLAPQGYEILEAADGGEALRCAREELPDLVLLSIRPSYLDAFEILRQLRDQSIVPIILLSTRDGEDEHIRGLEIGADDFVILPFSPGELSARVRAQLRRSAWNGALHPGLVEVDDRLQVDLEEREVIVDGHRIPLRPTEYRLLYHLVQHAGRTLPFDLLLSRVWGPEYRQETQYVHLYVRYLRRKIEPEPAHPRYILTKRGVGYRFRPLAAASCTRRSLIAIGGTNDPHPHNGNMTDVE